MKILLVDDDPFMLKLLGQQLAGLGYATVISHQQAKRALADLVTEPGPDVVFCDLQMPEMDGVEFVRYLAQIGYAGGLVLMSGEGGRILQTAEKLAKAHRLNVFGILSKPVAVEQLKRVLQGTLPQGIHRPSQARKAYSVEELRRALAAGELVNYYQPKICIKSRTVVGVETLVRWLHPADGLVFPDQFIATAEEHGLIDDLTGVVLSEALRQARLWLSDGLDLHVAVNISMDNLASLEFPDLVMQTAADAGIPMTCLVLEVTETRLMRDPLASLDILTRLRLKRIGLSIDDFGTGHSSLAQLRDIPFDELKVDRGFVHGAGRNASLRAIFDASLAMVKQLGMRTVAEGVEDRDDWDFLCQSGCDLAQGYFIAKPMPAEALMVWVSEWQTGGGEKL